MRVATEVCSNVKVHKFYLHFSLIVFITVLTFNAFAQHQDIFQEFPTTDLTKHYRTSGEKKDELMADKFDDLHRKEGFVISDVMYNGTLFTKSLSRSGTINFDSEATRYLNDIKDVLLKDYPEAREEISIYITYSPVLNAFATVDKNVYVNIGLLARLDNEAQLAYVLGHEIMHIINYHIIDKKRAENEEIQSLGKGDITLDNDMKELSQHEMSLKHEFEADMDGLNLFLLSNYKEKEAITALELLRDANHSIYSYESSSEFVYLEASDYKDMLDSARVQSKKEEGMKKVTDESTHPDIEDRIDTVSTSIEKLRDDKVGESLFIVSEDKFNELKTASFTSCSSMFRKSFDFISTFKNSTHRIHSGETDEELYDEIGYALFGLVVDKLNKVELRIHQNMTEVDSVMSYFYNTSSTYDLTKWAFSVIDTLQRNENSEVLDRYKEIIANAVAPSSKGQLMSLVEPFVKEKERKEELHLADIEFEVETRSDITGDQRRSFNEQQILEDEPEGKVAFFNVMNYNLKRAGFSAVTNLRRMENMNNRCASSILNLEEDYPNEFKSILPNEQEYKGEEYADYVLLNSWLRERMYFEGYNYISIYEDQIKKLREEKNIDYAMTSLRVEIKSFSVMKFLGYYAGIMFTPHYLPGMIAGIAVGSSRNYTLSLVFKLDDGALALWDKRTSLEPQTSAQIYATYQEMLNNLKSK